MSWEVRGAGEKPLLHLWSEQFTLTRRVLAITDHSERLGMRQYQIALGIRRTWANAYSANICRFEIFLHLRRFHR